MFQLLFKIASSMLYLALHVTHGKFPQPLNPVEEQRLIALSQNGDIKARNKLIEHNLRLVAHIVKKYYSKADSEDLISIGTIGLIKAVSTFNDSKGIKLATYASRCIENEILMYFRSLKKSERDVSLEDSVDTDKDGNALTFMDILSDGSDITIKTDTKIKTDKLKVLIFSALNEREREIIILRYGLNGKKPLPQREIAANLGISRSYVSRIEKAALSKLKPLL